MLLNGRGVIQLEAQGKVDARFAPVADVLLDGLRQGRDVGASVAVFIGDEAVVELWAGHRDRRRTVPWEQDTLCCVFSVSKALAAICVLQAVADGAIELDAPVAAYWPEFAAGGKGEVTTRQVLSHRSGVVAFHNHVDRGLLYDWTSVTAALACETPWWPPGEQHGYHARTFGFLLGEVLRRATGRTVGEWLRERVAGPLQADVHIGLADADLDRCAQMLPARIRPGAERDLSPERQRLMAAYSDPQTLTGATFQNPSLGPGYMNAADFRKAEMPAMNGHGTARGVAQVLAAINELLPADLLAEACRTHSFGTDAVLLSTTHFGLGFMLYDSAIPIGLRPGTFGHAGAGGAVAFHDREQQLSFCFVMNQMQEGVITGSESATRIAQALYSCL